MVEKALLETELELECQRRSQHKLQKLVNNKTKRLGVSEARIAVRALRPVREMTHDDVQLQLITQGKLLENFLHKLEKGQKATVSDIARLKDCRDALTADLLDKVLHVNNEDRRTGNY